jgi:hypothetical protein
VKGYEYKRKNQATKKKGKVRATNYKLKKRR